MKAAETSASSAIADCTPLTVVSRSRTTAAIDTFISEVSTTSTNIAIASSSPRRRSPDGPADSAGFGPLTLGPAGWTDKAGVWRSRGQLQGFHVLVHACAQIISDCAHRPYLG